MTAVVVRLVAGDHFRRLTARVEAGDDVPVVVLDSIPHHHHGPDHNQGNQDQDQGEFDHTLALLTAPPQSGIHR